MRHAPAALRWIVLPLVALGVGIGASCSEPNTVVQSENSPPTPPVPDPLTGAPADGSDRQSLTPVLSWSCTDADSDPLMYDVYLGTSATPPLFSSQRATRCVVPSPLEYGTVYYWYVVARDDHGHATVSDTWSFRTRNRDLQCGASAGTVRGWPPLVVDFSGTAAEGQPPYTYFWVFGDDSTSSAQNPVHVYDISGTYGAVLKVTDSEGSTCSKTVVVIVDGPPECESYATPTVGPPPLVVKFVGGAQKGQPPYTFDWDFGDGASSTAPSPGHTYTIEGDYDARCIITDTDLRSCTTFIPITVGPPLSCGASANPPSGPVPLDVQFLAEAAGGRSPYRYHWIFGDGSGSTQQNPSHVYVRDGYYTAVLTVTDASASSCSQSIRIIVRNAQ